MGVRDVLSAMRVLDLAVSPCVPPALGCYILRFMSLRRLPFDGFGPDLGSWNHVFSPDGSICWLSSSPFRFDLHKVGCPKGR